MTECFKGSVGVGLQDVKVAMRNFNDLRKVVKGEKDKALQAWKVSHPDDTRWLFSKGDWYKQLMKETDNDDYVFYAPPVVDMLEEAEYLDAGFSVTWSKMHKEVSVYNDLKSLASVESELIMVTPDQAKFISEYGE